MPRRFASVLFGQFLFWAVTACLPAYAENSAWDDAVAKAARISGLWEATPDRAQLLVIPEEVFLPVTRLFLGIHTRIRRNGDAVETTIMEARLELDERVDLSPPTHIYEQVPLGNPVPIEGGGIELSGQWHCCMASAEVRVRVVPGNDAHAVTVLISSAGKSSYIEFARPAANPDAPVQGDWITPGCALHIYVMEPFRIAATFDKISENQTDQGYPFADSGSDLKTGSLQMRLETMGAFNWIDGKLDGPDLLRVQWRGNGFLSGPEFHRQTAGAGAVH